MNLPRALTALLLAGWSLSLHAQFTEPAFEVASIRQHATPLRTIMGHTISGSRVTLEGYTVVQLILEAYHLKGIWQLSLPAAIAHDESIDIFYDLAARTPGERTFTPDEVRLMLQHLLATRFQLTVHRERKEVPVYALVSGRSGSKLKNSTTDARCSIHVGVVNGGQSYSFVNCTVATLVDMLSEGLVDRPVLDQTQMAGTYDFEFAATPHFMNRTDSDPAQMSPFTAVQELGFKLESRNAGMEIIAVESFQKPSES